MSPPPFLQERLRVLGGKDGIWSQGHLLLGSLYLKAGGKAGLLEVLLG